MPFNLPGTLILFLIIQIACVSFSQAKETNVFLYFETDAKPEAIIWWDEQDAFISKIITEEKNEKFHSLAQKPKSSGGLSHLILAKQPSENPAAELRPILTHNSQFITGEKLTAQKDRLKTQKTALMSIENSVTILKRKLTGLRADISLKIPIEEILKIREEVASLQEEKHRLDTESIVVAESLKALDENRINPDEFYLQGKKLEQINQEIRAKIYGGKPARKNK